MFNILLVTLGAVLLALGIIEFFSVLTRLFWGKVEQPCYLVVPLKGNESPEMQLRKILSGLRWSWLPGRQMVIADLGVQGEGLTVCQHFCNDTGCLMLTPQQLQEELNIGLQSP